MTQSAERPTADCQRETRRPTFIRKLERGVHQQIWAKTNRILLLGTDRVNLDVSLSPQAEAEHGKYLVLLNSTEIQKQFSTHHSAEAHRQFESVIQTRLRPKIQETAMLTTWVDPTLLKLEVPMAPMTDLMVTTQYKCITEQQVSMRCRKGTGRNTTYMHCHRKNRHMQSFNNEHKFRKLVLCCWISISLDGEC